MVSVSLCPIMFPKVAEILSLTHLLLCDVALLLPRQRRSIIPLPGSGLSSVTRSQAGNVEEVTLQDIQGQVKSSCATAALYSWNV